MNLDMSPAQSRLLAVCLLGMVLALAYHFLVAPGWLAYQTNRERIEDHREKIARFQGVVQGLAGARQRLRRLESSQAGNPILLRADSATLAAASLQERIKAVVEGHDGTLISTQVLPPEPAHGLLRISANVRMQADITALQGILHALESGVPYLVIDELMVLSRRGRGARSTAGSRTVRLDVRFGLSGFMAPPAGTEPGAGEAG